MRRGAPLPDAESAESGRCARSVPERPPAPPPDRSRCERCSSSSCPAATSTPPGVLHKTGAMRLATARDELLPLYDDKVRSQPRLLTVVLLARVITRLGTLVDDEVRSSVVENLFASDLAFLQDLYRRINTEGHSQGRGQMPGLR